MVWGTGYMPQFFLWFLSHSFFFFFFIATLFFDFFFFGCVGFSFRARAFSSCSKWGPLFIAVRGPLFITVRRPFTIAAPPVAGHRLQMRRLSSCGSRAQLLRGMWDLPRPGLEPVSPALAGRFSTTVPPGKPCPIPFFKNFIDVYFIHHKIHLLSCKHSNNPALDYFLHP